MRKLITFALSILLLTGCADTISEPITTKVISLKEAYNSICDVSSITDTNRIAFTGSGIVLENGLILTAGHVIDYNSNEKIDPEERTLQVDLDETGTWIEVEAIAITKYKTTSVDLGLLKPKKLSDMLKVMLIKGAKFSNNEIGLGEETIFIGRRKGIPASITKGIVSAEFSEKFGGYMMSSSSSWFGASGGGVFNSNNELSGVSSSIAFDQRLVRARVPIPYRDNEGGGVIFTNIGVNTSVPIPNMSFYTPLSKIKEFLTINNALPKKIEKPKPLMPKKYFYMLYMADIAFLIFTGLLAYRIYRRP